MSKEAEKIITAIAVVIGLICCVAVGAALFLGIGNEKQTAEYNEKYEFYEAVKYGNDKKVKEMLEANPVLVNLPLSVNEKEYAKNLCDDTPLIAAGVNMGMIRLLVDKGADVNLVTPISGRYAVTSVLARVEASRYDVAWFLIGKGADLNCEDRINGNLPYAAISQFAYGHSSGTQEKARELLEHLVKKGVKMNMPPSMKSDMSSLLGVAAKSNHCCAAEYLISLEKFGLNDIVTYDGKTALMVAAQHGCYQTVYMLFNKGAKEGTRDSLGRTAFDYAKMSGNDSIIALLK